ncbi:MAG TPA: hypothetical protein VGT60_00190 [Candidatus Limnocylindria bacterium]|nr:hypothetical protein [Candidatus Limnocylindria bacterium]
MATSAIGRIHGPHSRTAEPCPLCLAAAQPHAPRPKDTRFKPLVDAMLPWLLALGFTVPLTLAVDGPLQVLSAGVACGVLIGAAFAWQLHCRDRATGLAATARVRAELGAESDARANAVLVQFEWAVNDIATLRTKLERAEREVREHAQHAFAAERDVRRLERNLRERDRRSAVRAVREAAVPEPVAADPQSIALRCLLNDVSPLPWLDLGADDADNLPSRVRVFERDGNVICVSDPATYDGVTQSASLKLPLPPDLAAAVRRGVLDDYRFEALVAHRWVAVRLVASRTAHRDKRGRVYRPA